MKNAMDDRCKYIWRILKRQLESFWPVEDTDENRMIRDIEYAVKITEKALGASNKIYPHGYRFSELNTIAYAVFLYNLSHVLGIRGEDVILADKLYYLNKIMHGVDWYWNIQLPEHFICEHPIGTVLGRADYGDYLCVYQGVTVGANFIGEECVWPVLGRFVTLYTNAMVIGNCHIGNYVIISAGTFVMDEVIPDNCILYGGSPNLKIRECSEKEIRDRLVRIWKL